MTGTCGRPGEMIRQSDQPLGCWCVVRIAARVKRKQCWAREMGLDFGWTE